MAIVYLKWAIISPYFSIKTGYGLSKSCFKHSLTPNFVDISSSNYLNEKHNDGYFSIIS